jgi:hypothetical protein
MTQINYFLLDTSHLSDRSSTDKLKVMPLTIIKRQSPYRIKALFGPIEASGTVLTTRKNY